MKIINTGFKDLKIIAHKNHSDFRGSLRETYNKKIIHWDKFVFENLRRFGLVLYFFNKRFKFKGYFNFLNHYYRKNVVHTSPDRAGQLLAVFVKK